MKTLITGASNGIGAAIACKFIEEGHDVIGLDIDAPTIEHARYTHYVCDVRGELPDVSGVEILINNAGVQGSDSDIDVNLKGAIRVTEKYGVTNAIKSVLFIASASATTGAEFPEYCASKGGLVSYMKNVALRVAKFGATCNSLSPGGVITRSNDRVLHDARLWGKIMSLTPLEKWATVQEIAEWAYFVAAINRSMTAQDILIDNGEAAKAEFVW